MEKEEIDLVRASAQGVTRVLAPLLSALAQAEEVLSFASNATKLKATLEKDVADLQAQMEPLKAEIAQTRAAAQQTLAELRRREHEMRKRLEQVTAETQVQIDLAKAAAAENVQAAALEAQAQTDEFTREVQAKQQEHDATMAAMFSQEQEKADAVQALEARLAAAREQARLLAENLGR